VIPYAVWEFDASFVDIQGVAYDPATQRPYVSAAAADTTKPMVQVYQMTVR